MVAAPPWGLKHLAYQIEIGGITACANVVMKIADTLVPSGLSEKTSASTRDGVPGLRDVPGVQYLFSNKKTSEIQRSVLILVSPRSPVQLAEADRTTGDAMAATMKALRERFGLSAQVPSNVEAMRSTGDHLREALEFLYH